MRPTDSASCAKLRFFLLHHPAVHLIENKDRLSNNAHECDYEQLEQQGTPLPSSGHSET